MYRDYVSERPVIIAAIRAALLHNPHYEHIRSIYGKNSFYAVFCR